MKSDTVTSCVSSLPVDDLRRVFSCLDWRDLCSCSCVCRAWHALASADEMWQPFLAAKCLRFWMLPCYALLNEQQVRPAAAAALAFQQDSRLSVKGAFGKFKDLPALSHQTQLVRFHALLRLITGWRLRIELLPEPAAPAAGAGAGVLPAAGPQQNQQQSIAPAVAGSSSSISSSGGEPQETSLPLTGYPCALTMSGLEGSSGWCIGCVSVQQHEQSCWVRFELPMALMDNQQVAAAARDGRLRATLQVLTSAGWLNAADCCPFRVEGDDSGILLQSHRSGFYAWPQELEGLQPGEADRFRGIASSPLPWDLPAGTQQQKQPAATVLMEQHLYQQQVGSRRVRHRLHLMVYVHLEQLLLSSPAIRQLYADSMANAAVQAAADTAPARNPALTTLWLHLDMCHLHSGLRLGSCVAPLVLSRVGADSAVFEAEPSAVLVTLFNPNTSAGGASSSSSGLSGGGAAAGQATALQLVAKGLEVALGAGCRSSRGMVLADARAVLLDLISRDEVMVDFSLYDDAGRLLLGRAGVEVWSKECSCLYRPTKKQQLQQQQQLLQQLLQLEQQQQLPQLQAAELGEEQDAAPEDVAMQEHLAHLIEQLEVQHEADDGVDADYWHTFGPDDADADDDAAGVAPVAYYRTVHMLHFLVDNVASSLWENGVCIDAEQAPAGVRVPLVSMRLTVPVLQELFGQQHLDPEDMMQMLLA